ncbi:MAG: 2-C-methyl-D-erythritol 4-phosphate cytidylyltransferase [Oscillospiraceae bacterium]|jgi:2-C-methyl-D-erythritol 4-phosphate cytidylyltransferase|nr:2-C-methyl-D-erythritol 4-phosphate cytidylyltransferase [Oscillospiraceae bacterium]
MMALFSRRARCSAVIAAGGASDRMAGTDKLFAELGGVPVLARSVIAFAGCVEIDEVIVAVRREAIELAADLCAKYAGGADIKVVVGGDTRARSVYNGVFASSPRSGLIAIHDGARPFVSAGHIIKTISAARAHGAAALAVPVVSTLKTAQRGIVSGTVDRRGMYETQTPQVFRAEIIKAALTGALKKSLDMTDDCMAVEALGFPIHIVQGDRRNIKITERGDFALAEAIAAAFDGGAPENGERDEIAATRSPRSAVTKPAAARGGRR